MSTQDHISEDWLLCAAMTSVPSGGMPQLGIYGLRRLGAQAALIGPAIDSVQRCNHVQSLFAVVALNWNEVLGVIDSVLDALVRRAPLPDSTYVNINRVVMNYLASMRSYDNIAGRTLALPGEPPNSSHGDFTSARRTLAESNGPYAFTAELRNYAQHRWLPVLNAEVNSVDTRGFPVPPSSRQMAVGHIVHAVHIFVDRDELIGDYPGWLARKCVKEWLLHQPAQFDLLSVMDAAHTALTELHRIAMTEVRLAALEKLQVLLDLEREVQSTHPGSTPSLGRTSPENDGLIAEMNLQPLPMPLTHWIVGGCPPTSTVAPMH